MEKPKTIVEFVLDDLNQSELQFYALITIEDSGWSEEGEKELTAGFQAALEKVYKGFRVRLNRFVDPDRSTDNGG